MAVLLTQFLLDLNVCAVFMNTCADFAGAALAICPTLGLDGDPGPDSSRIPVFSKCEITPETPQRDRLPSQETFAPVLR